MRPTQLQRRPRRRGSKTRRISCPPGKSSWSSWACLLLSHALCLIKPCESHSDPSVHVNHFGGVVACHILDDDQRGLLLTPCSQYRDSFATNFVRLAFRIGECMGRYSVPADKVCVPSVVLHKPSDLDVTSLAFTPLYGRWSDIFGRKFMLITTLFVFLVFSLACALARTMIQVCYNISSAAYRCSPLCSSLSSVRSKALGEEVSTHLVADISVPLTSFVSAIMTMCFIM